MQIQLIDLKRQYSRMREDVNRRIQQVLDEGNYILGRQIAEMEQSLAEYVGAQRAVSCASGTDALLLALMALGLEPGDEVIVPSFTFIATAEVVALLGGKPVFVDSREDTYNIDPALVEAKISPRTVGIIPVDLFGQAADYEALLALARTHELWVVQDGAQSFGARHHDRRVPFQTPVSCTSFFPAKPLGCYGDGGMVFVDDKTLYETLLSLRVHGKGKDKYDNVRIGVNGRMDTLQAAVIQAKFAHFPAEVELRQQVADYYNRKLKGLCVTPEVLAHNRSVYAQYCIRLPNRGRVAEGLGKRGVPTAVYYPRPLHLQGAFAPLGYRRGDLPVCERVAEDILALPMHPYMTREEQDFVVDAVRSELEAQ